METMTYDDATIEGVVVHPIGRLAEVAPNELIEKLYGMMAAQKSFILYATGCIIADFLPKDLVVTGGDIVKITWKDIEGSGESRSEAFVDFAVKFFTHENGTKQVQQSRRKKYE